MMIKHLILFGIAAIALPLDTSHVAGVEVPRIRGISISTSSLYTPNADFECIDGSRRITFDKVNDDYCDCGDGSDEPGTSACFNGSFFCQNSGYRPLRIPSGRVNDGVCDCCDGTDEYTSDKQCIDICHELGKEATAEAEKAAELSREGNKIRLAMIEQGRQLKNDYTLRLSKLKSDYHEAELLKQEKDMIKNVAEERESIALEKYKTQETEPAQATNEELDDSAQLSEVEEYFKTLDKDESGSVTMFEVQLHKTFDKDGNGVVTEEEALYFLGHHDEVDFQEFYEKAWPNIKPFIMREQGTFESPNDVGVDADNQHAPDPLPEPVQEDQYDHVDDDMPRTDEDNHDDEEEDNDDEHYDNDENLNEHENEDEHEYQKNSPDGDEEASKSQVEYDEETQSIVDEANSARTHYHQAEKALLDLQNEMRSLEGKIERDYGPDDVFARLDSECFQYTNFEYVYSMCMYGRTTQSAKSGGSEVLLGHWQEWTGNDNNKYSQMKFGGGSACWNGPTRSSTVDLRCGLENKLISVAEPRRCEYIMAFETPAVCNVDINVNGAHDEL